jgi:hypothetical protein
MLNVQTVTLLWYTVYILVKIPLQFRMIPPVAFSFGTKIILKHFMVINIKGELVLLSPVI